MEPMTRTIALILAVVSLIGHAKAQAFKPRCPLPDQLKHTVPKRQSDFPCQLGGLQSKAVAAENRTKNNFCASDQDHPVEVTFDDLRKLDQLTKIRLDAEGIPYGTPSTVLSRRTELVTEFKVGNQTLKEGIAVFIRAFVLQTPQTNIRKKRKRSSDYRIQGKCPGDIIVSLVPALGSSLCTSVRAGISIHFRPVSWNHFNKHRFTRPVMIMGQLFFDSRYSPCHDLRTQPEASSRFEEGIRWGIHPVYEIFICKHPDLGSCPRNDASAWTVFEEWEDEQEGAPSSLAEETAEKETPSPATQADTDAKVSASLDSSRAEIMNAKQGLKPFGQGFDGQPTFKAEDVIYVVNSGKSELLNKLQGEPLAGLRAYIKESYPTVSPLNLQIDPVGGVSSSNTTKAFNNVGDFLTNLWTKLYGPNSSSTLDLKVESEPSEAFVEISADGGDLKKTTTPSTLTHIFRGRWHYKVWKDEFSGDSGPLDLVDEKGNLLRCKLFTKNEKRKSFCVRN